MFLLVSFLLSSSSFGWWLLCFSSEFFPFFFFFGSLSFFRSLSSFLFSLTDNWASMTFSPSSSSYNHSPRCSWLVGSWIIVFSVRPNDFFTTIVVLCMTCFVAEGKVVKRLTKIDARRWHTNELWMATVWGLRVPYWEKRWKTMKNLQRGVELWWLLNSFSGSVDWLSCRFCRRKSSRWASKGLGGPKKVTRGS